MLCQAKYPRVHLKKKKKKNSDPRAPLVIKESRSHLLWLYINLFLFAVFEFGLHSFCHDSIKVYNVEIFKSVAADVRARYGSSISLHK